MRKRKHPLKIVIERCTQCYFMGGYTGDITYGWCTEAKHRTFKDHEVDKGRPSWCPLRKGPIEISGAGD